MTTYTAQRHPDYTKAQPDVFLVRKFIEGEAAVKRETSTFLPHPNMLEPTSPEQVRRYGSYLMGAEVDDFPSRTQADLLGALNRQPIIANLPVSLKYLLEDSDGDWMSLQTSIEITAMNCLQVNYHILLAEYDQLPEELDGEEISVAQKAELKQKSSIKHYPRESLVDWAYGKVNGRLRLVYMRLEHCEIRRKEDGISYDATVCLELGISAGGENVEAGYWQKLTIYDKTESVEEGKAIYPKANGQNLDFIPAEIVMSQREVAGKLPVNCGYLAPLCYKAHHRYMVSADLKERLRILQDTSYSKGWDESKKEQFDTINGRKYFAFGAGVHNFLPDGVEMDILKMTADGDALFKYMEENAKQIRAIGGRFDTQDKSQETLGEVEIKDSKEKSVLTLLCNNTEHAYKNLICYCGLFEGLDLKPDDIDLKLNREFTSTKLSPEEVKSIRELVLDQLMTKEQAVEKLIAGGYMKGEVESILSELEQQGPAPIKQPLPPQ